MVKDRKAVQNNEAEQFLALKVQKSAEHYTEAAMDEVELLDCIHKERNKQRALPRNKKDSDKVSAGEMAEFSKYCATLHDSFFHTGPNGRHMCMVFSMLGCNFLSIIKAFNYRGIPIPVVKNMIRGICKGLDFLHRKCHIIHTDLKPENVLIIYEEDGNDNNDSGITGSLARLSIGGSGSGSGRNNTSSSEHNRLAESIKELEDSLQNKKLSQTERKRLRRRLKKKRQKARKKIFGSDDEGGGDDDGDDDETEDNDDDEEDDAAAVLSDWELSRMLNTATDLVSPRSDDGVVPATSSVKRRLNQSSFVDSNFGHRHKQADFKLMGLLQTVIDVRRPSSQELASTFTVASKENDGEGVAEIAFMLRAFTPEEELADGVSAALGGIPWDMSTDKSKREW